MRDEQTNGTQTGVSAYGSTSRSNSPRLAVCETVCLERAYVDDSHQGSERRPNAFFAERGLFSLATAHAKACQSSRR